MTPQNSPGAITLTLSNTFVLYCSVLPVRIERIGVPGIYCDDRKQSGTSVLLSQSGISQVAKKNMDFIEYDLVGFCGIYKKNTDFIEYNPVGISGI